MAYSEIEFECYNCGKKVIRVARKGSNKKFLCQQCGKKIIQTDRQIQIVHPLTTDHQIQIVHHITGLQILPDQVAINHLVPTGQVVTSLRAQTGLHPIKVLEAQAGQVVVRPNQAHHLPGLNGKDRVSSKKLGF